MTKKRVMGAAMPVLAAALLVALAWFVPGSSSTAEELAAPMTDEMKIASLMQELDAMSDNEFQRLRPIPAQRWELPEPGVHVMRARVDETYEIDGVGRDTVELSGWIAVKHGNLRAIEGAEELNWNTAILDTEFVGLDLKGDSDLFGPVHIRLDGTQPARGQVGRIEIPEEAERVLLARLSAEDAEGVASDASPARGERGEARAEQRIEGEAEQDDGIIRGQYKGPIGPNRGVPPFGDRKDLTVDEEEVLEPGACEAPVPVEIEMPELSLKMKTETQVRWFSLVDTIPPVGHTASVSVIPVRLISEGRPVGTLTDGVVKFRQVVRHVDLETPFLHDDGLVVAEGEAHTAQN